MLWATLASTSSVAQEQRGFVGFNYYGTQHPWNYQVIRRGTGPVRDGVSSERFELRAKDCGLSGPAAYDDCKHGRERAQRGESGTAALNKDHWYSFSIFLDPDIVPIDPANTILVEFRPRGPGQIILSIDFRFDGIVGVLGSVQTKQTNDMKPPPITKYQAIAQATKGVWHDFVVNARWSQGPDGFIDLYHDGVLKWQHRGRNAAYGQPVHMMYGIYRSFITTWITTYSNSDSLFRPRTQGSITG
jgi:Polysaccharide lyase